MLLWRKFIGRFLEYKLYVNNNFANYGMRSVRGILSPRRKTCMQLSGWLAVFSNLRQWPEKGFGLHLWRRQRLVVLADCLLMGRQPGSS